MSSCTVEGCGKTTHPKGAKGFCHNHYEKQRRHKLGATEHARRRAVYAALPADKHAKVRAYQSRYRKENREAIRAQQRAYGKANPGRWRDYRVDYRLANREELHFKKLKYKYGIGALEYEAMHIAQGGVCAICKQPERMKSKKFLSVDHDHSTGQVRALLCGMCNKGLGLFSDDPVQIDRAAAYLRSHL